MGAAARGPLDSALRRCSHGDQFNHGDDDRRRGDGLLPGRGVGGRLCGRPRSSAVSVVWRDELVLMGGAGTRVTTLNDVYSMNLQSLAWTARADAGWTPRFSLQAAVLADELYVCGGNQSPGYLNDVWRLTEWGAQWVQLANAPFSLRLYMSSIVLSSASLLGAYRARRAADTLSLSEPAASVWLLSGGIDYSHPAAYNTIYAFDGSQWTRESDALWEPRYGALMVPTSNKTLMMLGGQTENGGLNDVWTASFTVTSGGSAPTSASSSTGASPPPQPSTASSSSGSGVAPFVPPSDGPVLELLSEFVSLPSAPSWGPRSGFGAVLCGSNVLVLGGFALGSPYWLNEVHSMNPADGSWSQLADAPWTGRDQFAVSRINATTIVLTGGATENGPSNDVWAAHCSSGSGSSAPQWSLLSGSAAFAPRFAHASVVWGTQLVLLGGSNSPSLAGLNDVWTMDLTAAAASGQTQWVALPLAPWTPRQSFAAAVLGSSLFVSGGVSIHPPFNPLYLNDVWMMSSTLLGGAASEWTALTPASFSPRAFLASAALNGSAWFVCGGQGANDTVVSEPYFRFNGSWVAQPTPRWGMRRGARLVDLSDAQSSAAGGASPVALLLLGGSDATAVPLNDVWASYLGPAPAAPSSDSSSGFRWSSAGGAIAIIIIIAAILAIPTVGIRWWRRRSAGAAHAGYTRDYSQADHSLDAPILAGAQRSQPVY